MIFFREEEQEKMSYSYRKGFQYCCQVGKLQHAMGFFLVTMNAISVLKNVECFEVAVVLELEETTFLPYFSPQSLTLCEKNGLK